jgi:hypothetical protein
MIMSRRGLLPGLLAGLTFHGGWAASQELKLFRSRGNPRRTETAGTRGWSGDLVTVLLPHETALSARPAPVLSWFQARAFAGRAEISLTSPDKGAFIVREVIRSGIRPGIHHVALADLGTKLPPNLDHVFKVTLVRNPSDRQQDVVSTGTVQYLPHPPFADARAAGAAGYWLDALALADPATYAQLLEEAGLVAAAEWVRQHGLRRQRGG